MHAQGAGDRASYLASLIEAEGVRYGREDSFKLSRAGLLTQRFLLGVPLEELPVDRVMHLCGALGMPGSCRTLFLDHLGSANLVFFGLEDRGAECVYKVYLELWDAVRRQVLGTGRTGPLLLNIGFKWTAGGDGSDVRVARYHCYPLLSAYEILCRLQQVCADGCSTVLRSRASGIIQRAAAANPSASFLYVEVSEEGNPRRSFDVNLYKANLSVGDIHPFLSDVASHFCVPPDTFEPWLARIAACPLGHLSGGLDRNGHDFMTAYYETRALDDLPPAGGAAGGRVVLLPGRRTTGPK